MKVQMLYALCQSADTHTTYDLTYKRTRSYTRLETNSNDAGAFLLAKHLPGAVRRDFRNFTCFCHTGDMEGTPLCLAHFGSPVAYACSANMKSPDFVMKMDAVSSRPLLVRRQYRRVASRV